MAVKRKILTNLKISEVSSVDVGAGKGVKILLRKRLEEEPYWKRDFSAAERHRDAKSGAALPDGSFPIHNASDLHNAMVLAGKAKNPAKARAHIRSRAAALGLSGHLSGSYKKGDVMSIQSIFAKFFGGADNTVVIDKSVATLAESVGSILADENADHQAALTTTFEQFGDHLKKTLTAGPAVTDEESSDMNISVFAKALGLAEGASEADIVKTLGGVVSEIKKLKGELMLAKAQATLSPEEFEFWKKSEYDKEEDDGEIDLKGEKAAERKEESEVKAEDRDENRKGGGRHPGQKQGKRFIDMTKAERVEVMAKDAGMPEYVRKIMADNEAMRKRMEALEKGETLVTMAKRAVEHGLPESEAETLAKAYTGDREAIGKLLTFTKSAVNAARTGKLFEEFGATVGKSHADDAYAQIQQKADEIRKQNPALSQAQAFAKAYEGNPELSAQERRENRPRVS